MEINTSLSQRKGGCSRISSVGILLLFTKIMFLLQVSEPKSNSLVERNLNVPGGFSSYISASDLISISGLVLTLIALSIAVWQTAEARRQTKDLRKQADNMSVISEAMSTKYLGSYPDYLIDISNLIKKTNKEFLVLCTVPMHGIFNAHDSWFENKQAIEKLITTGNGNGPVQPICIFTDSDNRVALQKLQYNYARQDWDKWKDGPENTKLKRFLANLGKCNTDRDISFENFIELLEVAAQRELETTYRGASINEIDYSPPMYLWISDKKEAIFVLKTVFPRFSAEAFWTTDARLIASLVSIHDNFVHHPKRPDATKGFFGSVN